MLEWLERWLEYATCWLVLALMSSHGPIKGKLSFVALPVVRINR